MPDSTTLDALIDAATKDWGELSVERDGWYLAAAHIRLAYAAGYSDGLVTRSDDQHPA